MIRKPVIFITNDDGIYAKGLNNLIEFLKGMGEIIVVAPDCHQSGMSCSITSAEPLRYRLIEKDEKNDLTIYCCTGTPVDCVKLGISQILKKNPDLLVSGINHGSNAAISVHYSGTMGAAIEGCIFGVPSIGFSLLNHHPDADFSFTREIIRNLTAEILKTGLPKGVCLNVNFPKGKLNGLKVCSQTNGKWVEEFYRSTDGLKRDVFWLTGRFQNFEPENKDTDEWALVNGYASLVPVKIDITSYEHLDQMKSWENLI